MTVVIGHLIAYPTAPALGVVLFFVLSGFLMGKLYLAKAFSFQNVWAYVVSRFARVYPLFAFVIIATATINAIVPAQIFNLQPQAAWVHLGLMGDANTVWTISAEFQFYAAFVVVWAVAARFLRPIVTTLGMLTCSVMAAGWLGTDAGRIDLIGYLPIFLSGTLIAQLLDSSPPVLENAAGWILPSAGMLYGAYFLAIPHLYVERWVYLDPIAIGLCVALVASAVSASRSWTHKLLSLPPLVWLGELSFGIYLLHRHAQWLVDNAMPNASVLIGLPAKILLTFCLAQLAYSLIETPSRHWLRAVGARVFPKAENEER